MKDSKEYSKKIKRLYRSLSRKYPKPQKVTHDEPADALVYAIIRNEFSEKATQTAIKKFADYFVDLNDLRVSKAEEIIEMLGSDTPVTRDIASIIVRVLTAIFNGYHRVSLESLKKTGKRPAKQALEKMDGTNRFVVDYCMLTSLQGHAIPLTKKMVEYLRSNELVHAGTDEQEIEGFLAKQIPAKNAHEFYALLQCESEKGTGRKKKKKAKTTRRKTAKKTTKTKKKTKQGKRKK
jgi:endonuclease III